MAVVDLTIVSCVVPTLLGGRELDDAAALLQPLLDAGVPMVLYVEQGWKERIEARCAGDVVRCQDTSASRRWAGFALRAELETARAASAHPDLPSLDYFVATLTKMGMLHDQSIWNPFGTRYLAWIDADLTASVHPRYFTDARLLEALPGLLRRFLVLSRPSFIADAAGVARASRVQTQLFGGEVREIAHVNAMYFQLLEQMLRDGELPTDEAILTRLLERHPERFDRFVLQENGLAGCLFEEMRSMRVSIEHTAVF